MRWHGRGAHFLERRREFCVSRDWSFYLVPERRPRTVRREFSEVRRFRIGPRHEVAGSCDRERRLSLELPRRVQCGGSKRADERTARFPRSHGRSPGGILGSSAAARASDNAGREAAKAFAESAKAVLRNRVRNSPPERNEARWLPGWLKRVDTYLGS